MRPVTIDADQLAYYVDSLEKALDAFYWDTSKQDEARLMSELGLLKAYTQSLGMSTSWANYANTNRTCDPAPFEPTKSPQPRCDCGAEKSNTTHSDWCSVNG